MKQIVMTNYGANISKFIYTKTQIWILFPEVITLIIQNVIQNNSKECHAINFCIDSLLQKLKLLNDKHWKFITFKSSLMLDLMDLSQHIYGEAAIWEDSMSLILIIYWLSYYRLFLIYLLSNSKFAVKKANLLPQLIIRNPMILTTAMNQY